MRPPLDPMLWRITPDFGIHWYGILIVTGVMLGAVYASWRAQQDGESPDHVWNALIIAIILAIIGARLYHVFSEPTGGTVGWSYYRENPVEILRIDKGGLGIYGAIVGGVLGVVIYAWYSKLRPLQWLDYGAPGLALGQAIGRWGNFINQELYGPPTDLPWGLIIDPEHRITPYRDLVTYPLETLFHPTFLYESLWCLLVFIALALIVRNLKDWLLPGDVLLGYIILYPLGRFFIEFLRPDAWMVGPIAAAQLFAIIFMLGAAALLVVRHVAAGRTGPAVAPITGSASESTVESSDEATVESAVEGADESTVESAVEQEAKDAAEPAVEPADEG
jgi:phosphatidylglycerol:prolipoprotein diacylglycerol transferase